MPQTINILWSDLTSLIGLEATIIANRSPDLAITDSIILHPRSKTLKENAELFQQVQWHPCYENTLTADRIRDRVDVIVNFSHAKVLDQIVDLALRINKPLIHCGCEVRIPELLNDAAKHIPTFYSKSFSIELSHFVGIHAANYDVTAEYILKIARAMHSKTPGEIYTLTRLWPELADSP